MIKSSPLPANALLSVYRDNSDYLDCFTIDTKGRVSLAEYILAFYTSAMFKPERAILTFVLGKKSTDQDAHDLAFSICDQFSAWHVEQRNENQIIMCDFQKRSRSWLMVMPVGEGKYSQGTRLFFGTVIMPVEKTKTGRMIARLMVRALIWFHRLYARVLLYGAIRNL
jgi:hypothetical protein